MKKFISILIILCISITYIYARSVYSIVEFNEVSRASPYTYNASSVAATQVTVNTDPKGIIVSNKNAFEVWLCTYAATSGVYDIEANETIILNLPAYTSYWYILGGAGQATSTIDVLELW